MDEMNGNNNETTANEKNANVKYIHGVPIYTEPTETAETKADGAKSADGANPFAEIPHGGVSRKMKKRTIALIIAAPVVLFLVYWFFIRFTPSVEVEGHKLTLTTKVKELDKMRLVLLDGDGNKVQYGTEIATKTFYGNTFEVYVNRDGAMKKSGVYVMIFNQYENTRKVEDCTFYMIRYYPKNQDAGVEVLINGQDFSKLTLDTLQEKARAAKIPFNELEMADLIKGKRKTVTGSTTMYRYELEYSYEAFRFELQSSVVTSLK